MNYHTRPTAVRCFLGILSAEMVTACHSGVVCVILNPNHTRFYEIVIKQTFREIAYLYFQTTNVPISLLSLEGELIEQIGVPLEYCDLINSYPIHQLNEHHYCNVEGTNNTHFLSLKVRSSEGELIVIAGPIRYEISLDDEPNTSDCAGIKITHLRRGTTNQHYKLLEHLFACDDLIFNDIQQDLSPLESLEKNIIEYREIDFYHHDFAAESNAFTHMFRHGDQSVLQKGKQELDGQVGRMAKDKAGNTRNWHVIGMGLFARKTIELGVAPHIAFTLSDNYLRRLEQCDSVADMDMVSQECFRAMYNAIQLSNRSKYSKLMNDAMTFIDRNLTTKFTLDDVASHLKVNASYLSKLFKSEINQSFTDYLLCLRVTEAKRLIRYSSYSLLEISGILSFSSKSYFIQCFKKVEGVTPTQFKRSLFDTAH